MGPRGAGCAIVEKLDDQPEEDFPLRFGAASGVGRAALEDGGESPSELRDLRKGQEVVNKSRPRNDGTVAHGTSDGLVAPFDLHLLAFVRQFLLHGTGAGGKLPRLTRKGVGVAIESSRLCGPTLRVAIEQTAWAGGRRCAYAIDEGSRGGRGGRGSRRRRWRVRGGQFRLGRMTLWRTTV